MHKDDSKQKNLRALYEQRRERIVNRISDINLMEYTIMQYNNLKNKFGIVEGICLSGLFLIISGCLLKNPTAVILLSSSIGFGFVSIYNIKKYNKMKSLKEEYPEVDFSTYNFRENDEEKENLFKELFNIDNILLNPCESFKDYELVESDSAIVYKSDTFIDLKDSSIKYSGYEIVSNKNNKKLVLIKKKGDK